MVLLFAEQVHLDRTLEVSVTGRLLQWHLVRVVERKKEGKKEKKSLLRTCHGLVWVAVHARSVAMNTYS